MVEMTLGTHRFQRAVVGKDVLIGTICPWRRFACVERLLFAILRVPPWARCGPPIGFLPTTARWKRCVPRARVKLWQTSARPALL